MKLKFPEGITTYIAADGSQHRPDADYCITVDDGNGGMITDLRNAGFVTVVEEAPAEEVAKTPTDEDKGKALKDVPVKVTPEQEALLKEAQELHKAALEAVTADPTEANQVALEAAAKALAALTEQ